MNERGDVRLLTEGEQPRDGEILAPANYEDLSIRARREYYRTIKQGGSVEFAMACAQAEQRREQAR